MYILIRESSDFEVKDIEGMRTYFTDDDDCIIGYPGGKRQQSVCHRVINIKAETEEEAIEKAASISLWRKDA